MDCNDAKHLTHPRRRRRRRRRWASNDGGDDDDRGTTTMMTPLETSFGGGGASASAMISHGRRGPPPRRSAAATRRVLAGDNTLALYAIALVLWCAIVAPFFAPDPSAAEIVAAASAPCTSAFPTAEAFAVTPRLRSSSPSSLRTGTKGKEKLVRSYADARRPSMAEAARGDDNEASSSKRHHPPATARKDRHPPNNNRRNVEDRRANGNNRGGRGGGGRRTAANGFPQQQQRRRAGPPSAAGGGIGSDDDPLVRAKALNHELMQCTSSQDVLSLFAAKGGSIQKLAGGGNFNSVNLSTFLHRLARFSTMNTNQNAALGGGRGRGPGGGSSGTADAESNRRSILSDPRFALLVCSLGEAVALADYTMSVPDALEAAAQYKLAESSSNDNDTAADDGGKAKKKGGQLPPLIPKLQHAARGPGVPIGSSIKFTSREFSNAAWAVAKLRLAPPDETQPVVRCTENQRRLGWTSEHEAGGERGDEATKLSSTDDIYVTKDDIMVDLILTSLDVRSEILNVARERSALSDPAARAAVPSRWIPTLSRLCGKVFDVIAVRVFDLRQRLNPQELANLMYAFAKVGRGDAMLFDLVSEQLVKEMGKVDPEAPHRPRGSWKTAPKPQEASNSIWALATTGIRCPGQISLIKFIADTLDASDGMFYGIEFKAQEMSNSAWGVASLLSKRENGGASIDDEVENDAVLRILRWVARSLRDRVDEFKPQELSNTCWAFATVGFGCEEISQGVNVNDYLYLPSDRPEEDRALMKEALDVVARSALSRLDRFRPQELNNLAWGFSRLGYRNYARPSIFEGIGEEVLRRYSNFAPQDVGTTLWSFATAEYFNEDVYQAAASRLTLESSVFYRPQEMSNTIWALATAGVKPKHVHIFDTTLIPASQRPRFAQLRDDPVTECFAAAANELMRRPHEFKTQEIKDVLWSFSKVGIRHPALFKAVAEHFVMNRQEDGDELIQFTSHSGRGFNGFSPQGLSNMAWSYARQAQLSFDAVDTIEGVKIGSTGRLAVYETSCLDIGEILIKRFFACLAEAGLKDIGLNRFKEQDLANTVWALSTLGLLHREYFQSVAEQIIHRISDRRGLFKPIECCNILWSFAILNVRAPKMMEILSSYIVSSFSTNGRLDEQRITSSFKRLELANVAWSCAVLQHYPAGLMQLVYTGMMGKGQEEDSERLKCIYGDDGLQKSSVMTLLYVQMALCMDAPHLRLALPQNFPEGWGKEANDHALPLEEIEEYTKISPSMLELSVSKLQKDVSASFQRIGFDVELEHIVDTKELKESNGITLSSSSLQVLSIDIADTKRKIGVEVDGPSHFVSIIDTARKESIPERLENEDFACVIERELRWQGQLYRVNGPTALKHRLLCHLGWSIIHLPYWEYQALNGNQNKEDLYCSRLLEDVKQ